MLLKLIKYQKTKYKGLRIQVRDAIFFIFDKNTVFSDKKPNLFRGILFNFSSTSFNCCSVMESKSCFFEEQMS